ncbi:MAG: ImmA/IrrE family metallo-endopeptidase [Planctomycetes bacterium]|nr:ImmA/IrrE family metallo-endopeptidase [Planctomycetota bacterium]
MLNLPPIDPERLGGLLAEARKARGLTQQEAAAHLKCSRPILIAIEKGTRPPKPEEIIKLASLYGRSVHELVRPGEPVADLQPHLRAIASKVEPGNGQVEAAIQTLQRFSENYCELERLMDAPMNFSYPPEVQLANHVKIDVLAEDVAIRERNRLGLGDQPIYELRSLLETNVGLRIMYGNLPSRIAGMYAYAGALGCCILINRKHPVERRRASLVHEFGHVVVDRYKPGVDYLTHPGKKPANERFAEAFGMCLLMPPTSLRRRFNEIVSTTGDFHVADLCRLSNLYFVSVEAMAYRLEDLTLIPEGTIKHLRESRFEVRKAKEILQLPKQQETNKPYPDRYVYLAVHAYEKAKISEGQLARFLDVDRVTAREIVEQMSQSTSVMDDGTVEECRLDFQRSLLAEN